MKSTSNLTIASRRTRQPVALPRDDDGDLFPYEMTIDGGQSRVYAHTPHKLLEALIDGYSSMNPADREKARIRLAFDAQVRAQAALNLELIDGPLSAEEETVLRGPRHELPELVAWNHTVPLILLTSAYTPTTERRRPTGDIIWIDPSTDLSLLTTLDAIGFVGLAILDPALALVSVEERLGCYWPLNPETRDHSGLTYNGVYLELLEQGVTVASARMTTERMASIWAEQLFVTAFPEVTHWYGLTAWTGRVTLAMDDVYEPEDRAVSGTITYHTDPETAWPWRVETGEVVDITVPLPPFETAEDPALALLLANTLLALIGGDIGHGEVLLSALIKSGDMDQAFNDGEVMHIALTRLVEDDLQVVGEYRGSPREIFSAGLTKVLPPTSI